MKVLLIEIGNTNAKWCLTDGHQYSHIDRCVNSVKAIKDKMECLLKFINPQYIIMVSGLGLRFNRQVKIEIERITSQKIVILNKSIIQSIIPIKTRYDPIENLGIDRYLLLIAAKSTYPEYNLIVVDSGTATTIDLMTQDNVHYGGLIMPGKIMLQHCITNHIDSLRDVNIIAFNSGVQPLQITTNNNIASGGYYAWFGGINMALFNIMKSAKNNYKIVVTGGDGELLSQLLEYEVVCDPLLIFKGIYKVFENYK